MHIAVYVIAAFLGTGQILLPPSNWKGGLSEASKMDDSPSVLFFVRAEKEVTGWLDKTYRPGLILRCREKKLDVYVDTGMAAQPELGRSKSASVRLRFDEGQPMTAVWNESTANTSLFAPNPRPLIKQIASSKRLLFQFTPFNASPVIVEFDTQGFSSQHLNLLAGTCNWKP